MAEEETIRHEGGGSRGAYRAYLLRCWREEAGGGAPWRFTLVQMGDDHSKKGFASLEDLTAFLREELSQVESSALPGDSEGQYFPRK